MQQHETAIALIKSLETEQNINEATTRLRIIDTILSDILSIPKNAIVCEEHVSATGYIDYAIKNSINETVLIIEAKKEDIGFELPNNNFNNKNQAHIKIKTLISNPEIKSAMEQARNYCFNKGVLYGAITNGKIWIFFKAFASDFYEKNAFVIGNLKFFSDNFSEAYNLLNYTSIIKPNGLESFLSNKASKIKSSYSIKNHITAFSVPVDLNEYAQYISKPIKYYFGDFEIEDKEFLNNCYVDERLYENTKKTLTSLLVDSATPYLKNQGVIDYEREKLSKKLSKKITNFIEYSENKHIVVIYGDRGCGKSTFIKKLIYSDISQTIQNQLAVVYLDLLEYAATEANEELKKLIWKSVLKKIDAHQLQEDYTAIQNILYKDEFIKYKSQIASLYAEGSEIYGIRIEEKIKEILNDYSELAKRLANYLRHIDKNEIVLVLDNTDQFSAEIQDFCFQVLAEIFSAINCLSIITMREERFFRSKQVGVLDAYETTQYHISSPQADKVFLQRLDYLIDSLENDIFFNNLVHNDTVDKELVTKNNFKKYFLVFKKDFSRKANLYNFLVSCAQKDMRKALDLFRELVVSGYMNIREILSTEGNIYTLQIHQVLKPLMTPHKYFYEESSSSIPNIFQLRSLENGSHFTSIRILKYLNRNGNNYASLAVIKSDFLAIFDMKEDFEANISILIEYKLIEANIKVDKYIPDIEDIIITPYGKYFIEILIHFFTYLDLICTDCNIYCEQTANFIIKSADEEYKLFDNNRRGERLVKRIDKTGLFLDYLIKQENEEIERFNLNENYIVMPEINSKYQADIIGVKKSALRQNYSEEELENLSTML